MGIRKRYSPDRRKGGVIMFYIGQKVVIDACCLERGMVGEIIAIDNSRPFPVKINVNSPIGLIQGLFKFEEFRPVPSAAKII